MSADLCKVFKYIDDHSENFVENLREAVAIKNVSAWVDSRNECKRMINYTLSKLKDLGLTTILKDIGSEKIDNKDVPNPPVIFAQLGSDPKKITLLIYGHLDVQPAKQSDGWATDPWKLTQINDCLYARGSTDDKGPVLGWLHTIEAYQNKFVDIPVNLKLILESMEEVGSSGLETLLLSEKEKFLKGIDAVVISDNYWLGTEKPCLTYGLRGICYFMIEVECGRKDLHSGVFGGTFREAMPDLVWLLSHLVDGDGNILIPGIMDDVCEVSSDEAKLYTAIDFDVQRFQDETGFKGLLSQEKEKTLMNRWRYPCLSIHGIEGDFSDPGNKTVIPCKVTGKFSIRIVPNQEPGKIEEIVKSYLNKLWQTRKSPNSFRVWVDNKGRPWQASPQHPNYQAAAGAIRTVFDQDPQFTREGGSIGVTRVLQEVTGKNVLLLPMGQSDDGAHSQNEKINKRNYILGTKVFAAYLEEIAKFDKNAL